MSSAAAKAQPRDEDGDFVAVGDICPRPLTAGRVREELRQLAHVSERTARQALAELIDLQRQLLEEMRGLRADLRRQAASVDLEAAWRESIGPSPMTSAGLVRWVEDDAYDPLSVALAAFVDFSKPGRAVSLGKRLATLPWLEARDDSNRGFLTYRLRGD